MLISGFRLRRVLDEDDAAAQALPGMLLEEALPVMPSGQRTSASARPTMKGAMCGQTSA